MRFVHVKTRDRERERSEYTVVAVCVCIFCTLSEREGGRASHPQVSYC